MAELHTGYQQAVSMPVVTAFDLMSHHAKNNEMPDRT
jgi:hypothetical protein